jgi:ribosomal protein S18 acetylase RimI-like enzyme
VYTIARYDAARHHQGIRRILEENGWERRYIAGQLAGIEDLTCDRRSGVLGVVFVALPDDPLRPALQRVWGFVSVEFREWNRLGQLQGLAVAPDLKRRGIASALVRQAEEFVLGRTGRGVYVDTPITNEAARTLYQDLGYELAYTMPEYYDDRLDGVTYLKLFSNRRGPRV